MLEDIVFKGKVAQEDENHTRGLLVEWFKCDSDCDLHILLSVPLRHGYSWLIALDIADVNHLRRGFSIQPFKEFLQTLLLLYVNAHIVFPS